MNLIIGRIPFLVCAPFFHFFLRKEQEFPQFTFVDAPPKEQCEKLKKGLIHLSPASSIFFAQKPEALVLSPKLCTSCSFEVRSVKLFSHFPIEELNQKKLRLTSQSMTSVTLLKILMKERFHVSPLYVDGVSYMKNDDACLLIGDLALEEGEKKFFEYSYDLGTLWETWHGLPFVFGAWIISKEALKNEIKPLLLDYLEKTEKSIECFKNQKDSALDKWLAKYPVSLKRNIITDYYKNLDYHFTENRKDSLKLFYEYAKKVGVIEKVPQLEFL